MICWFEEFVTDSHGGNLEKLHGLGLITGSACPHFDGEADRRPTYIKLIQDGSVSGGIALDDGAGALYVDEALNQCVSSRPRAKAMIFETKTAAEKTLAITYLGSNDLVGVNEASHLR